MLNTVKQEAANVLLSFSGQFVKGLVMGGDRQKELYTDLLQLHSLVGYMTELFEENGTYYLGSREVTNLEIQVVRSKIQYYAGREEVDYDNFGDEADPIPTPGIPTEYRAGFIISVPGINTVVFKEQGVASPLPSTDYVLICWNVANDGAMQTNLGVSVKTAGGFTVPDVLNAGKLYYEAIMST